MFSVIRKPAETLFSSANSVSFNYIGSPSTSASSSTRAIETTTAYSDSTTTTFYTVDLTAGTCSINYTKRSTLTFSETPSTLESDIIFNSQENLPPLGMKIKKNANYIELPGENLTTRRLLFQR